MKRKIIALQFVFAVLLTTIGIADEGPAKDVPELEALANYVGTCDVAITSKDSPFVKGETPRSYRDRSHFFASAATAMRHILVDGARAKLAEKRGGDRERKPLEDLAAQQADEELLALHEALDELATQDPVKAKLVELRYFVGLTGDKAAEVLGISTSTADRHWVFARAWLQAKVRG